MEINGINFFLKSTLIKTPFDIDSDHTKNVEKLIRDSLEYRKYIADKRQNDGENSDVLLPQFDFKDCKKSKLELHHHVFLYDLVYTAYQYLIKNKKEYISTFEVAQLVMTWHYRNIIPYIFLAETSHGLYHDGKYEYPLSEVKGNYQIFYNEYKDYMTETAKRKLEELMELK